jgi:DUF1365 family protein
MTPAPQSICLGEVKHRRHSTHPHSFRYRLMSILIDIDGNFAPKPTSLFAIDRWRPICFSSRDHGRGDGDIRSWIRTVLPALSPSLGRIQVLTTPRVLGLVFNPISVFFCFDTADTLRGVVFEVSNFYQGRQAYAFNVDPDNRGGIKFRCEKKFYVSPFNPPGGEYRFNLMRENGVYVLGVRLFRDDQLCLTATHIASEKPLTRQEIARAFPFNLFNPSLIVGAILFEASRLWARGLKFHQPRKNSADTRPWRSGQ